MTANEAAIDDLNLRGNLFAAAISPSADEVFEILLSRPGVRIERIVSTGQATAPGEWLSQDAAEWVVLLSGSASLRFEEPPHDLDLAPGDWVTIERHRRHRVERTDDTTATVWLAIHIDD